MSALHQGVFLQNLSMCQARAHPNNLEPHTNRAVDNIEMHGAAFSGTPCH